MLYPQNGDGIVTTDSVTSLHPMYKFLAESWQVFKAAAAVVIRQVRHGRPHIGANQWRIQDFCKGVRQLVPLECPKPLHALSPSDP